MPQFTDFVVDVYRRFSREAGSFMAATLSYYALFSIFPLLLLAISIAGFFLTDSVSNYILDYTKQVLPQFDTVVRDNVEAISANRQSVGIVGLVALLWIGTAVFDALSYIMDRVWDIKNGRHFILVKLLSVAGVIFVILLLILTTLFSTAFEAFQTYWSQFFRAEPPLQAFRFGAWILAQFITFLTLSIIYAVIPNKKLGFRDVWIGAAFTTVVFDAAKRLFIIYTTRIARFNAIYGSVGVIIGLLFWLYIIGVILILGADINAALKDYKDGRGGGQEGKIEPNGN